MMPPSLWKGRQALVLASGSAIRRQMLEQAGIPVRVRPAHIDERAVERALGPMASPVEQATRLAEAKALAVASDEKTAIVLGADQILTHDGHVLHKPVDRQAAAAQLVTLAGRTHRLTSAAVLVQDGTVIARCVDEADLTMRPLEPGFIDSYLAAAGDAALASVGCYQLEALGVHLFAAIQGNHFTILGLPLLQVLAALRETGWVAS